MLTVYPSDDPNYAEAVEVYTKFLAESWKLDVAGGAETLPPVFKELISGGYYNATEELYKKRFATKTTMSASIGPQVTVKRGSAKLESGEVVSITACVDASRVGIRKDNKPVGNGSRARETLFFGDKPSAMKIIAANSQRVVTCSGE